MITYQIPTDGMVRLEIYNILGETLATLVNEEKPAGKFAVTFDGSQLTSGIYFYRLNVIARGGKSYSQTNKMILMK
jgi:flagellar hook assembly protein FlgD